MENQFQIRELKKEDKWIHLDFFIDDKPLSMLLNIDRFDLTYHDFDLDIIETVNEKFPDYDRRKNNRNASSWFLGNDEPMNQFGSNRIVLYRCHCGCDYCGVISFVLEKGNDHIIWKDITYENDDFEDEKDVLKRTGLKPISELKFDRKKYELEFEKYLEKYSA